MSISIGQTSYHSQVYPQQAYPQPGHSLLPMPSLTVSINLSLLPVALPAPTVVQQAQTSVQQDATATQGFAQSQAMQLPQSVSGWQGQSGAYPLIYPPVATPAPTPTPSHSPAYPVYDTSASSWAGGYDLAASFSLVQSVMGFMMTLLQMFTGLLGQPQSSLSPNAVGSGNNGSASGNTSSGNAGSGSTTSSTVYDNDGDDYDTPTYLPEQPDYEPPAPIYDYEPPVYDNPYYPPPAKLKGSAGLYGDPKFALFTPQLQNATSLSALKEFDSGLKAGQSETLLADTDNGGFQVIGTGVQVNPLDTNSIGVGEAGMIVGNQVVVFKSNGDLVVDDQVVGNINSAGTIAEITLQNGAKVSTTMRIDDAQGNQKERFVIRTGEYEVTAAVRNPHPDAHSYLDMNFEELTDNAADNATGYQVSVPGFGSVGIADLLKLEL